jgi:hypothetical protein
VATDKKKPPRQLMRASGASFYFICQTHITASGITEANANGGGHILYYPCPVEAATRMAEGNPGAATVVGQLLEDPVGLVDLCHLDDMGLYGPDIWISYWDVCKQDIELLRDKIRDGSIRDEVRETPDWEYIHGQEAA